MILSQANPDLSIDQQVEWLTDLMDWVRLPVEVTKDRRKGPIQSARLKFLIQFLVRHPELRVNVAETFQSILIKIKPLELFCQTGLTLEHGFLRELFDRMFSGILPKHNDLKDLSVLFGRVFYLEEDADWLADIDGDTMNALFDLLLTDESAIKTIAAKMSDAMADAILILVTRVCALSVVQDMRQRMPIKSVSDSPFFKLQSLIIISKDQIGTGELSELKTEQILNQLTICKDILSEIYNVLENSGVSVELVFQLEVAQIMLERIESLIQLRFYTEVDSRRQIFRFVGDLARSEFLSESVVELLSTNLNLISKKIVERTGETGEHYITRTRKEYREMFFSAGGGGVLTVGTTIFKTIILKLNLPLFFEGFFAASNYAISFTLMQFSHFTLATKTPAMTAAALASKLHSIKDESSLNDFVTEATHLIRSGFIAAIGNVGLVTTGAFLVDAVIYKMSGSHFVSEEYALQQMRKHSPFLSLTLWYATFTGGVLWLGSVMGGWIENWFTYRRLSTAIEENKRLKIVLGADGPYKLSQWLKRNISGIGTSVSLGCLMGFSAIIGKFFGVPIDIRHVTLSSGTLAFSLSGLEDISEHIAPILYAYLGVVCIGILNLFVSFSIALFVAARARNIRLNDFLFLLKVIGKRFLRNPRDYFFPPKESKNRKELAI